MDSNNFLVQQIVKFTGNQGYFNEQPVFVLVTNKALTGGEFISLCRTRTGIDENSSGNLSLYHGSSAGIIAATGSNGIYTQSFSADRTTTSADQNEYTISTVMTDSKTLDIILNDSGILFGDMSSTGLNAITSDFKYIGTGIRADSEQIPADGTPGNSQVLFYTYNREELSSSLTSVTDRSGNSLSAEIKGAGSGDASAATVTGFSYSPCEGGFRFEGKTWLESVSSHLFNAATANGYSILTYVKLAATGATNILSVGSSATETMSFKEESGTLRLQVGASSVTAGFLSPGQWYFIAGVVNIATDDTSGSYLYINGQSASFSGSMNSAPAVNSDTRLLVGKDLGLVLSGITGAVGLTRIFNRPLSATEILCNYLATIPSMSIQNSLKIA